MAKFNKIIFLNKEYQILDNQSASKLKMLQIEKNLTKEIPTITPSPVSIKSTNQAHLIILQSQQKTHKLLLLPAPISELRNNVDDEFPRAVKLFMINYYFKTEYKELNRVELSAIAEKVNVSLTMDDVRFIEEITQRRQKSWYWKKLRTGRVTSSKFKSVCEASLSDPDHNLLKEICYPEKCVYAATNYEVERMAISSFTSQMKALHKNFNFKRIGLVVNSNFPYFAATPNGACSCACCGEYFVEIKCPFEAAQRNASVENLMQLNDSFMEAVNGIFHLRHDHRYYYQLQMQMALRQYQYSYFYVWSSRFRITNKILFDSKFWRRNSEKALKFAKEVLSIELMSSYFTKMY